MGQNKNILFSFALLPSAMALLPKADFQRGIFIVHGKPENEQMHLFRRSVNFTKTQKVSFFVSVSKEQQVNRVVKSLQKQKKTNEKKVKCENSS